MARIFDPDEAPVGWQRFVRQSGHDDVLMAGNDEGRWPLFAARLKRAEVVACKQTITQTRQGFLCAIQALVLENVVDHFARNQTGYGYKHLKYRLQLLPALGFDETG